MQMDLDTPNAPSCSDAVVYGDPPDGTRALIVVEAKREENFGPRVCDWIKDGDTTAKPSRGQRLLFLESTLGLRHNPDAEFRYQLYHRTAAAILAGQLAGIDPCLVLVHSFSPKRVQEIRWRLTGPSPS